MLCWLGTGWCILLVCVRRRIIRVSIIRGGSWMGLVVGGGIVIKVDDQQIVGHSLVTRWQRLLSTRVESYIACRVHLVPDFESMRILTFVVV